MPSSAVAPPVLHSFPTRRSSDLGAERRIPGEPLELERGGRRAARERHGRRRHDQRELRGHDQLSRKFDRNHDHGHGRRRDTHHDPRSEEHTSELQSLRHLVCRLLPSPPLSYTLSLHDALPISAPSGGFLVNLSSSNAAVAALPASVTVAAGTTSASFAVTTSSVASSTAITITGTGGGVTRTTTQDRKSTRLNSSHLGISYAVFCRRPPCPTLFPYTTLFRSRRRAADSW